LFWKLCVRDTSALAGEVILRRNHRFLTIRQSCMLSKTGAKLAVPRIGQMPLFSCVIKRQIYTVRLGAQDLASSPRGGGLQVTSE
jgi:hypothetical protein